MKSWSRAAWAAPMISSGLAFAGGRLDHKIAPLPKERELLELANTFNRMGDELSAARNKLLTWNDELERTVEQRTRELREAQASLLETRKLAAVGQLGAGVAHEINNPLATVLGAAQNLIAKKRKNGVAEDDAELAGLLRVERAANRCRDITRTLLRFSQRSADSKREAVAVARLTDDALALVGANFEAAGHTIVVEHQEHGAEILGDAGELTQVLVHLLNNAHTALLRHGPSTVLVRSERVEQLIKLSVIDAGRGVAPDIRDRVFEPFFTTKDVWQNLGLGLSESFRIVNDHGGRIELDSEVGRGTTVTLHLPSVSGADGRGSA
jgi:C4-dicarboxylate-specific signal transduction histidine kinase